MISVLVLTYNEEVNLPTCLKSLQFSDDVVVFDSYSTDRTVDIATAAGARVIQRKFDTWSSHQNWAVENIKFKHPWVYYSDADEVVTPELAAEMLSIAGEMSRPEVAYHLRFKNMFMGRWLRYSSLYPTWVMRFFRPQYVRWERVVNPSPVIRGREGLLEGHFLHYSFRKGLYEWFAKHNRYSTGEAIETIKALKQRPAPVRDLFSSDPTRRRTALKNWSFRMPGRPLLKFFYMSVVKRGILDGVPGITYCCLQAIYEFQIVLKVIEQRWLERELRLNGRLPPEVAPSVKVFSSGDLSTAAAGSV